MQKRPRYAFDDELITCAICLEEYNDKERSPLELGCHTFCKPCLLRLPSKICPMCRKPFSTSVEHLSINKTIVQLLNSKSIIDISALPPPSPRALLSSYSVSSVKVFKIIEQKVHIWSHPLDQGHPQNKQLTAVQKGKIISGQIVRNSYGDFCQLESNQGYVAVKRASSSLSSEEIPFEKKLGVFRVPDSFDQGLSLRIFPDYDTKLIYQNSNFPKNSFVVSTGRVTGEFGDTFVRVKHPSGEEGWLFLTREGKACLDPFRLDLEADFCILEAEYTTNITKLQRIVEDGLELVVIEEKRIAMLEEARKQAEERITKLREAEEEARRGERERERERLQILQLGGKCTWLLQHTDHIPDDMKDYQCAVVSNGGYLVVSKYGYVSGHGYSANIDKMLIQHQYKNFKYIAAGPNDQYYMLKTNGRSSWHILDSSLSAKIKDNDSAVKMLALGEDHYFVVFTDGSMSWNIQNPNFCSVARSAKEIITVWIGDETSYYIKYKCSNGEEKCSYRNLPGKLQSAVTVMGRDVRQVLCENNCFFIRYN